MLWRKPNLGRLATFSALIFLAYVVLVWISSGYYLSAARAPLDERWDAVLLRALLWLGAFVALGTIVIWGRRLRSRPTD
jgi:hypothetical protein